MKDIKITNSLPLAPSYYGPKANPLNCDYGRSLWGGPGSRHFSMSHSDVSPILYLNAVNTGVASSYRSNLSAISPFSESAFGLGVYQLYFFFVIAYFLLFDLHCVIWEGSWVKMIIIIIWANTFWIICFMPGTRAFYLTIYFLPYNPFRR